MRLVTGWSTMRRGRGRAVYQSPVASIMCQCWDLIRRWLASHAGIQGSTRLFVVLSKEPDEYDPGKRKSEKPNYFCGIWGKHGNGEG